MENLVIMGLALLLVGALLIVIGIVQNGDVKIGIGGFIGPFPFGFANDPRMLQIVIILTIITAAVFILFALR